MYILVESLIFVISCPLLQAYIEVPVVLQVDDTFFLFLFTGSMTHLQALQISIKFLLQIYILLH